jgi:hypothetical protein
MRAIFKNTLCILIIGLVIYLICLLMKPKEMKPLYMKNTANTAKLNANANVNIYLNADQAANTNSRRSQQGPFVVDRVPLVVENPVIIPANEIVQMNYKDCNETVLKDEMEKEFYTKDAPLFAEKGPTTLVPFDLNDGTHRRVNFY